MTQSEVGGFTPALGRPELTQDYDRVIAIMTRERRWRGALVALMAPGEHDRIVDVGCGTGTLAIQLKQRAPGAQMIGLDPDEAVLSLAREKAAREEIVVDWRRCHGDQAVAELGPEVATMVVSSLVLHQCPMPMKLAILKNMYTLLEPGGRFYVADYGLQRTFLMKQLFRQVQMLDGFENTKPNAKGVLIDLMVEAGFVDASEAKVVQTPTGSISLYTGSRLF